MGFMDKLSNILGGDTSAPQETVKGPSAILREHGIDPSDLKFAFKQDGSVNISGHAKNQAECDRICDLIKDIPKVSGVTSNIIAGAAEPMLEPEPEVIIAKKKL